jgi:hypothetical protein
MKKLALTLGALSLFACAVPTFKFSGVGEARPPKPPDCQVTVYSSMPVKPHDELGTLSIRYEGNTAYLTELKDVMKAIQPEVCKAGGDAAVARPNEHGAYVRATVLSSEVSQKAPSGIVEEDLGDVGGTAPPSDALLGDKPSDKPGEKSGGKPGKKSGK